MQTRWLARLRIRRASRLRASTRVWLVTVVMALAGVLLALSLPSEVSPDAPLHVPWWLLALGFAASEIFIVVYQFRRDRLIISLMELPLGVALFFSAAPAVIAARLIGGGLALSLYRRQPPVKVAFNCASFVLETAIAFTLFNALVATPDGGDPAALVAGMFSTSVVVLVTLVFIAMVLTISEGTLDHRFFVRLSLATMIVSFANSSMAMVTVNTLWSSRGAAWLLLIPAAILFLGYQSYARLRQRHDDLELLYDFTRRAGRAFEVDSAMTEILSQVRTVLRADIAELVVESTDGAPLLLSTALRGENEGLVLTLLPLEDPVWARTLQTEKPILAAMPIRDREMRDELAVHECRDAIVAPLRRVNDTILGYILAGDRLGDQNTFTVEDLKLLETLANHAGVSLENKHLVERLRLEVLEKQHQALHDALTGLPNRTLFHQRVEEALATDRPTKVAVLLLDLDRFKEVNDTLGHHHGDLLLEEVGDRLRRTLRAGDTVARLGGDEFAVLLTDLAGEDAAVAVASGVRAALQRPIDVGEVLLDVGASIGIAIWPDHGDEATVLLQRADVAMYDAKQSHRGVEVYDPDRDTYSLERLALVGELRSAIDTGQLSVHYQPKADARTGRVTGVEALVRWHHHRHGSVSPEEMIGIAEKTGLIRPLTLWVLSQALRQCRTWRNDGRFLGIAVNLSFRNIVDAELPNDVARVLDDLGLPPSALVLEMTESSIMVDPARTIEVLSRLRSMGVGVAIDDFGTGYASFSYLRRLPVEEIKIDRSFVTHLATDESDAVIVRTIIDLGRNLGLRVVAEGVEDRGSWEVLAALGCDSVQGYVMTPALPADEFAVWLDLYSAELDLADAESEQEADVVALRPERRNWRAEQP